MNTYKSIFKHIIKPISFTIFVLAKVTVISSESAQAKTESATIVVGHDEGFWFTTARNVKSVKVKVSSSHVKVKAYKSNGSLTVKAKSVGRSTVKVEYRLKSGKRGKYVLKINIISVKTLCKRAFKIQNEMRNEKGSESLEWSEEAYKFAKYRLKTSGFDKHERMMRDARDFFGGYYYATQLFNSENLASPGSNSPKRLMNLWKSSSGHYKNLLKPEYKCGAIAKDGGNYIAVFFKISSKELDSWREYNEKLAAITVKAFDTSTEKYITSEAFSYYEKGNKNDTIRSDRIRSSGEATVYVEIGKTYIFFDKYIDDSDNSMNHIEITVTDASPQTIEFIKT